MNVVPKQDKFRFFVDGKEFETEQPSLSGRDIKVQAEISGDYQLFLEADDDKPDQSISDDEAVSLSGDKKHFYSVPPATFGNYDR